MIRRAASGDFLTATDLADNYAAGRFLTTQLDGNGVALPRWKAVGLPLVQATVLAGATTITGAAGYQDIGQYVTLNQDTNAEPGFQTADRFVVQAQIEATNTDASSHTLGWRLMRSIDNGTYSFIPSVGGAIAARTMAQNVVTEINLLALHSIGTVPTNNVRFSLFPVVDYASPNTYISLARLSLVVTRIRPV
jgi:hypothetical protein